MHLCLKDENGNYYDDNMIIYVALHELAHIATKMIPKGFKIPDGASIIIYTVSNVFFSIAAIMSSPILIR